MADRCYCIFEGGGAKGIAHVGALAALEKSGLDLAGFAGTSAGALVAALAAAGYTSGEMFGPSGSILDLIDDDPENEAGGRPVHPVATPPRLLGRSGWQAMQWVDRSAPVLAILVLAAIIVPWLLHWSGLTGEAEAVILIPVLATAAIGWAWLVARGLGSVEPVRDAINQALSLKVRDSRSRDPVTFLELKEAGKTPLRIVASDISRGRLALFSAEDTPGIAVADAVAASICLPLVFQPWKVRDLLHFDGGLVSNLPAWAFDPQRAIDRDAWTAAIEIGGPGHGEPSGFGILKAAALTAAFGSAMLNVRGVDRLRRLRLSVELGLLEFNFTKERAAEIINDARDKAKLSLIAQLVDIPLQMNRICEQAVSDARTTLEMARGKPLKGHLRAAIFLPIPDDVTAVRMEFSHGFQDHTDERIRLPLDGSFVGEALKKGGVLFVARSDIEKWNASFTTAECRWVRKMLWREMQWLMCIPCTHKPSGRSIVLAIDGNRRLGLRRGILRTTLLSLSTHLATISETALPKELIDGNVD